MSKSNEKGDIPHELRSKLAAFDSSLTTVEERFQPLLDTPLNELNATLSTLDKAKLDLVAAYSINSLFWMYLNVCGVNPKDHGIKQELDRIRGYMNRLKEIQEKEKAPSLNVDASKRFVKSALWKAAQNKSLTETEGASPQTHTEETASHKEQDDSQQKQKHSSKRKSSDHHKGGKGKKSKRYTDT